MSEPFVASGIKNKTAEVQCEPGQLPADFADIIAAAKAPLILRGLVLHWPLTQLSLDAAGSAYDNASACAAYLLSFYNGRPTQVYQGAAGQRGRYFYNDSRTALNYVTQTGQVDAVLTQLLDAMTLPDPAAAPSVYIASNLLHSHFPALQDTHRIEIPKPALQAALQDTHRSNLPDALQDTQRSDTLQDTHRKEPAFATEPDRVSIWLGNQSLAACHYDASDNLACCVRGVRRFTLFPPEQVANLYPGPLEPTPGGQAISMVDFAAPDLTLYPNFPKALAAGQIADLAPGDALYLPSMWWHQVEAPGPFNILINHWWSSAPRYTGSGMNLLYHALLCLRDKPEHERRGWQALLNYYVFDDPQQAGAHLPAAARGVLADLDEHRARQLRAMLLNRLNR